MKNLEYIKEYILYLKIEKRMSENTVFAYEQDVLKLLKYLDHNSIELNEIKYIDLENFINFISDIVGSSSTQARIVSGVKSFFKFLELEKYIDENPSEILEAPKITKKLPDTLSLEEIDNIISSIDLSSSEGQRNKAILEVLYGCGLRVSELVNLKLSDLFFEEGFIKVFGKGNKERFVPIAEYTQKYVMIYVNNNRNLLKIEDGYKDILFLNRRGKKLTRMMIFTIIRNLVDKSGIKKGISPHTFRHSFATHLLDGGADISSIQKMLGHESITTTQIYIHISQNKLREEIIKYHPRNKS